MAGQIGPRGLVLLGQDSRGEGEVKTAWSEGLNV